MDNDTQDNEDDNSGPVIVYGVSQDQADREWVEGFIGNSIPEGSLIKGFIAIIAWITPDGAEKHRSYTCMDAGLTEHIGHLERAKFDFLHSSAIESENDNE